MLSQRHIQPQRLNPNDLVERREQALREAVEHGTELVTDIRIYLQTPRWGTPESVRSLAKRLEEIARINNELCQCAREKSWDVSKRSTGARIIGSCQIIIPKLRAFENVARFAISPKEISQDTSATRGIFEEIIQSLLKKQLAPALEEFLEIAGGGKRLKQDQQET